MNMDMDIDELNKKYFGFLEDEYEFVYNNGVYSREDIELQILVTGFTAGVLSYVQIFVWIKENPKYTRISFENIIKYFLGAQPYLEDSFNSLLKNYEKLSSMLREYISQILHHHEEWLLPSMKIGFEETLQRIFRGNLQPMLTSPDEFEIYSYIKSKDSSWNPDNKKNNVSIWD